MTTSRQSHRIRTPPPSARQPPAPLSAVDGGDIRVRRRIRPQWVSFVVFGVALVVLGFVALGTIGFAMSASALVVSGFLLLAGTMQTIQAVCVRSWHGFSRLLVAGVLSLVVGDLMLANLVASELLLAPLVATFFTVGGIVRIAAACSFTFPGRHYALTNDVVTVLFGLIIGIEWHTSGAATVGTFVAIDLIVDGWSLVMAAVGIYELGHRPRRRLRLVRCTPAAA
jgi:uncharacterized membrane protein HdeD (DUF308 family)